MQTLPNRFHLLDNNRRSFEDSTHPHESTGVAQTSHVQKWSCSHTEGNPGHIEGRFRAARYSHRLPMHTLLNCSQRSFIGQQAAGSGTAESSPFWKNMHWSPGCMLAHTWCACSPGSRGLPWAVGRWHACVEGEW